MVFVVTATRMEQPLDTVGTTVSVVGSHQIEEQQIHAAGDVLRQVPGVEINQSGSAGTQTDVSIRGSTAAQTLILMDGVDVNSGATGGFDIADVTSDDLDRIEVVRGAGGALYGSSAIGGVVNLITREGSGPLKLSYDGEGGNRATQRQAVVFDGAEGGWRTRARCRTSRPPRFVRATRASTISRASHAWTIISAPTRNSPASRVTSAPT